MKEEKKAWALIDAGYDGNFNGGEAYESVFFQNSNNSVRVTDEFMEAVEKDGEWTTHAVVTGAPMETFKARYLLNKMAEAAWVCGDPGIQTTTPQPLEHQFEHRADQCLEPLRHRDTLRPMRAGATDSLVGKSECD
jgi:hypothetical protein